MPILLIQTKEYLAISIADVILLVGPNSSERRILEFDIKREQWQQAVTK